MVVDERTRRALYERLEQALGMEAATTLMEHLPPVGWADVATTRDLDVHAVALRGDLAALGDALRTDMAAFRTDLAALDSALRSDLVALEQRMNERFDAQDTVLDLAMSGLRHEFTATLRAEITTALTAQTRTIFVGLVGSLAALTGLAHSLSRLLR